MPLNTSTFQILLTLTLILFLNACCCELTFNQLNDYRIVKTLNGKLRGKRNVTLFDQKIYYSFRGVPYAVAPLGELRFKPPISPTTWSGIQDAFEYKSECLQVDHWNQGPNGSEDCLYLNIFVPENLSNDKLPVMFFIHGGAYSRGSANAYGPDFLINNDVILITINYRLGVLGFMSLGTSDYSGNMGLKDQWMALKWINDNIVFFGGDKTKITIFGQSAGSSSTHFHTISPKSRGLFQRAIMQSASGLNPFAFYLEKSHLKEMKEFAKQCGNSTYNTKDLIEFLKNIDGNFLVKQLNEILYIADSGTKKCDLKWAPIAEISNAADPFLTEFPEDILKNSESTNVDTLFGYTSAEMLTLALSDLTDPTALKSFDEMFELQLPKKHLKYEYNSEVYKEISKDIRKFYFPKYTKVDEAVSEYNELISDIWFTYGIIDAARLQYGYSSGKTYLYEFSLKSQLSMLYHMFGINNFNIPGSPHGEDLLYVFRIQNSLFGETYTDLQKNLSTESIEVQSIRLVTKLWTNFAKYGTPTLPTDSINFKPIENDVINYGHITNEGLIPEQNPREKNIQFWDSLYVKYKHVFHNYVTVKDEL